MSGQRYYWLKLNKDFFKSKRIKKLRKLAGGDTFTIIYLKMQLLSTPTEGVLTYTGLEDTIAEEIALDIDEDPENVKITLSYLLKTGLCEMLGENELFLPFVADSVGSEGSSAKRVRDFRNRQKAFDPPKVEAKTNAERQNAYRAKKVCEENGHVPFIEDHVNKKRYGGNYYICFRRDKCECAICGAKEDLCMHHIDGYDENKPQNNYTNKMLTLCRKCHSNVHAGEPIPEEILESIGYYDFRNESNEICNTAVTDVKQIVNGEIDIDIEIDKDKEKEKNKYIKHSYGEYKHVKLTDDQYRRLVEDYGEPAVLAGIKKVDEYCQEKGKTYKDYNLTLRKWGIDGPKLQKPKESKKEKTDEEEMTDEEFFALVDAGVFDERRA